MPICLRDIERDQKCDMRDMTKMWPVAIRGFLYKPRNNGICDQNVTKFGRDAR